MSNARKIAYNKETSREWGWHPEWFGAMFFDDHLIDKVKEFQEQHEDLEDDGLVGSMTFRRIWLYREANIHEFIPYGPLTERDGRMIVFNGNLFPIEWKKVVLWGEPDGMGIHPGNYTNMARTVEPREIGMGVTHWDVCLHSKSCVQVLNKRGVSVQFCIDNDGTIYQLLDMDHIAWHGSKNVVNNASVGVEISNAYYLKYQDWYVEHGFGERPIIKGATVHGRKMEDHLGFYPVQLEALKALWTAVGQACSIPLDAPTSDTVVGPVANGTYRGFVHHYQITRNKIDCGGLDLRGLLDAA